LGIYELKYTLVIIQLPFKIWGVSRDILIFDQKEIFGPFSKYWLKKATNKFFPTSQILEGIRYNQTHLFSSEKF